MKENEPYKVVVTGEAGLEVDRRFEGPYPVEDHGVPYLQTEWAHEDEKAPLYKEGKRILGLRPTTFWLLVLLTLVVIIAAVGGGVGGSMAVKNAKTESRPEAPAAIASPSPANTQAAQTGIYTVLPPIAAGLINASCPTDNIVTTHDFQKNRTVRYKCMPQRDVLSSPLTGLVAYSLQDCADACWTMNAVHAGKISCVSFSIAGNLTDGYVTHNLANCFLRGNATSTSADINWTSGVLCQDDACEQTYQTNE